MIFIYGFFSCHLNFSEQAHQAFIQGKDSYAKERLVFPAVFNAINGLSELLVLFFLFCSSVSGSY